MGAMNLRRNLSTLHLECGILIGAMEYIKIIDVIFATDCSQLMKMESSTNGQLLLHLEEFQRNKTFFLTFKIQHIPKAINLVVDKFAQSVKSSLSIVFIVDSISPVWLSEPQLFNFVFVVKKSYGV